MKDTKTKKRPRCRAVVNLGYPVGGKRKDVAPGEDCSDCPALDWALRKGYAEEGAPIVREDGDD